MALFLLFAGTVATAVLVLPRLVFVFMLVLLLLSTMAAKFISVNEKSTGIKKYFFFFLQNGHVTKDDIKCTYLDVCVFSRALKMLR